MLLSLQVTAILSPTDISSLLYLSDTKQYTLNSINTQLEEIVNEKMKRVEDRWLFGGSNVRFPSFQNVLLGFDVRDEGYKRKEGLDQS